MQDIQREEIDKAIEEIAAHDNTEGGDNIVYVDLLQEEIVYLSDSEEEEEEVQESSSSDSYSISSNQDKISDSEFQLKSVKDLTARSMNDEQMRNA